MKTVTEKYHAVNEGTLSKAEFVRQMRLAHPQLISQFNGFNDSVQILKNKGLLFEKKEEVEYENPSYNLSPDAVRRGLRYELILAGLDPAGEISEEDYTKAHKKAEDNIMKDQLHYYRMIADDKTKIEHDKMKETKRGAQETDTDNAMAKVKLNENVSKKQLIRESAESCIAAIKNKYPDDGDAMIKDFIKMHERDIAGKTPEQCVGEYEEYRTANLDSLDETESSANEAVVTERVGALQDFISLIQDRAAETGFTELEEAEEVLEAIADHYGMSLKIRHIDVSEPNENKLEAKGKDHDGDGDIDSDDYMAAKDKAIKKAMGKDVNEAEEKIKRALKKKIVQILKEGTLNEAATDALQLYVSRNDEHSDDAKALLDVIEAMEKDLMKHNSKVKDLFEKIGPFMAPAIYNAFATDYEKLNTELFLGRIKQNLPKTQKFEDGAELDELEEKQTVFNENKKRK